MNLLTETLIISFSMAVISSVPLYSVTFRKYSNLFYLLGTGALAGILGFDLIPDLYALGGSRSMGYVGIVWIIYSGIHLVHLRRHRHDEDLQDHDIPHSHYGDRTNLFFLFSMVAHCFASGMLLVTSEAFSSGLNRSIFLALFAHKIYESLTVSSVLIEKQSSRQKAVVSIAIYSLALPLGVVFTYFFRSNLTPSLALVVTSLAAGTLLGCLIFDFFLPSLSQIRKQKSTIAWIIMGLLSAQFFMKAL
jgi:zinc transporter ZupT